MGIHPWTDLMLSLFYEALDIPFLTLRRGKSNPLKGDWDESAYLLWSLGIGVLLGSWVLLAS